MSLAAQPSLSPSGPPKADRSPQAAMDPFSPEALRFPRSWDQQLLDAGPAVWLSGRQVWGVGRYDVLHAAVEDWESFGSSERAFTNPNFSFPKSLIADDPPTHTVSRGVMNRLLNAPALRALEARITEQAQAHVRACVARGQFDVVVDLLQPYILKVMGDAIGMKVVDRSPLLPFGQLVQNTPGPFDETFMDSYRRAEAAIPWVQEQCSRPALTEDGFGARIYAAVDRGEVGPEEAPSLILAFLGAGIDTSVAAIANTVEALIAHPDQWRALRQQPDKARWAFEEALRYAPPARFLTRVARKDTTFAGAEISKGDGMLLFISAAGRDARRWSEPDRFDIGRNTIGHLTFGRGIHNCVGQVLARMEAIAMLTALADQIEDIALAGDIVPQVSNQITSAANLPVRISAAA